MTTPTPEDGCKTEEVSADQEEIRRLRHELDGLTNAGVVECMVRNKAVFERISDLESDLAAAQSENAKLKAHAEAMAEAMENLEADQTMEVYYFDELSAYRRDFPKDAP